MTLARRLPAVGAVGIFLIAGTAFGEAVPPWEVPDEPWHAAYAESIVAGRLPTLAETYEAHQPPLYYALTAIGLKLIGRPVLERSQDNLYFPFDAAAYRHPPDEPAVSPLRIVRRLSSLIGAVTICLTWALGVAVGGSGRAAAAALAAFAVALLPQHVFVANGVNNDVSAAAAGAAIAYGAARWQRGGTRAARGLGALAAGAALGVATKLNVLALVPVALIAAIMIGLDPARGPRPAVRGLVAALAPAIAVAGALMLAVPELWEAMRRSAFDRALRPVALDVDADYFLLQLRRTLTSTIGRFGWLQIDLPAAAYRSAGIVTALSALGLCVSLAPRAGDGSDSRMGPSRRRLQGSLGLLAAGVLITLGAVMRNLVVDPQPQGRLLFPALAAAAVLVAVGWVHLFDAGAGVAEAVTGVRPSRLQARVAGLLWCAVPLAVLVVANAVAVATVLPSAFERSTLEPPAGQRLERRLPETRQLAARLESPGHRVVQTLTASTEGLRRVSVPIVNVRPRGALVMSVRHPASGLVSSKRHELDRAAYERWPWIDVEAPAGLPRSPAEALELSIELEGDGVAVLWGSLEDYDPEGRLSGAPVGDDPRRDLVLLLHYASTP